MANERLADFDEWQERQAAAFPCRDKKLSLQHARQ
jgi:hypothetical protein